MLVYLIGCKFNYFKESANNKFKQEYWSTALLTGK